MLTPAERFKGWIDSLAESWKDRLRGWMASWVEKGAEELFDALEPELREEIRPQLQAIIDTEGIPEDIKDICRKALETGSFIQFVVILPYLIMVLVMIGYGATMPIATAISYPAHRFVKDFRLDPATITSAWLRDKEAYEKLWKDLEDLGWDDDRLAVAKELAKIIPPLADMVRFADFSAFDPVVIKRWREFYDAPGWIVDPFALIGITNEAPRDWANKYWFSHWRQPGRYELGDMYRRGLLGKPLVGGEEIGEAGGEGEAEATIKLAYRTMGYSSFWQDALLQLVREIPTRVDVRRWWDMRTIDEAELRSIYQRRGYFGKDLENYVLWTKVYVAFPDIIARYKNGWINEATAKSELAATGLTEPRLTELWETKFKKAAPERVETERDLTVTDIIMGVKKGIITRAEGIELIEDLGYDREQAEFKVDVRVSVEAGSPETVEEFRDLTQKWRKAVGMPSKPVTEELKRAAAEVVRLIREVESLKEALETEEKGLVEEEVLPEAATAKRDELRLTLHRAEAELQRVKTEYDSLVAQWRHKEV